MWTYDNKMIHIFDVKSITTFTKFKVQSLLAKSAENMLLAINKYK